MTRIFVAMDNCARPVSGTSSCSSNDSGGVSEMAIGGSVVVIMRCCRGTRFCDKRQNKVSASTAIFCEQCHGVFCRSKCFNLHKLAEPGAGGCVPRRWKMTREVFEKLVRNVIKKLNYPILKI
jgi:hypothetical protein